MTPQAQEIPFPSPVPLMELWASGFNAWGNLCFDDNTEKIWPDLHNFNPVLRDEEISPRALYRSATLVETSTGMKFAGNPREIKGILAALGDPSGGTYWPTAVAGNERVAALISGVIKQFDSLEDVRIGAGSEGQKNYQLLDNFDAIVTQVVANSTSFTALTATGTVHTWGDGRITERLGREVSDKCPADTPCVVEDLQSIGKVTKISSGGTLTAALTSENDIYIWGNGSTTEPLSRLWNPTPYPLDLHGQDFLDVAVGNHHVIVLTTEHKIFVIGANESGQLGRNDRRDYPDWTEVSLPLKGTQHVTKVFAGHNNSLLLVENIE